MFIEFTTHWAIKRFRRRKNISNYMIEYCIRNSPKIRDKYWEEAYNAISKIPPSNRKLKVVYKTKGKNIKILTAYWLD